MDENKKLKDGKNKIELDIIDEEQKGKEEILAILDQNSDKISADQGSDQEDVTSLYATAKVKHVDED